MNKKLSKLFRYCCCLSTTNIHYDYIVMIWSYCIMDGTQIFFRRRYHRRTHKNFILSPAHAFLSHFLSLSLRHKYLRKWRETSTTTRIHKYREKWFWLYDFCARLYGKDKKRKKNKEKPERTLRFFLSISS